MKRIAAYCVLLMFALIVTSGCSNQKANPITPSSSNSILELPAPDIREDQNSHNLIGMWRVSFDIGNREASILPYRSLDAHYNVTSFIQPPQMTINDFNPVTNVIDVDVTITNPSNLIVYDVRLIIFTDAIGHQLLNPDNWTTLYDIPGGLPINPFKAYAKDQANRIFSEQSQHTENLQVYLPQRNANVTFAIDVSYPGNCIEPYEISGFTQGFLSNATGSSCDVSVTVKDWQDDISDVYLYCPEITGITLERFTKTAPGNYELILINRTGAISQIYQGCVLVYSSGSSSLALYEAVAINITHIDTQWVQVWGTDQWTWPWCMKIDENGYIYVAGEFGGSLDFDPGPREQIRQSNGSHDAYICKYDQNLNFLWVQIWGSSNSDAVYSICTDETESLYLTGYFSGICDFDPGPGENTHDTFGNEDIYLVKFNPDGVLIWVQTIGGIEDDKGIACTLDNQHNILLTGWFSSESVDFDPGSGIDSHASGGYMDAFLCKFDSDGNHIWAQTWGGAGYDGGGHLMYDGNQNVYISYDFAQTVDFDPGTGTDIHTSNGSQDAYLCKYDLDGNFIWAQTWGGIESDNCADVFGNDTQSIFVTGYFRDTVDFNPDPALEETRVSNGDKDDYFSKFSSQGEFIWVNVWGSTGNTTGDEPMDAYIDKFNNIYITGTYDGTVDFDPSTDIYEVNCAGLYDFFLSKFNPDGDFEWVRTWGGNGCDGSLTVESNKSGNIYLTGHFSSTMDFNPGSGVDRRSPIDHYYPSAYLLKLLPNGYWE
jgi:hypothetical protein